VTVDWKAAPGAPIPDAAHVSASLRFMSVRDTY
jgi:hypothetical protein